MTGPSDTSVVIATDVGPLPGDLAVSAATVAELRFRVLVASRVPAPWDLLVVATAHAHAAQLYARNVGDFAGVEDLVEVVTVLTREHVLTARAEQVTAT